MTNSHKKIINTLKKVVIVYCAAYIGFYGHSLITNNPKPQPIPTIHSQPAVVLGDSTQTSTSLESTISAQIETATPPSLSVQDTQTLEAWWSTMEYNDRLDVTITAQEPIECEFQITLYNGKQSTIRQTVPMETETCSFETVLSHPYYLLWGQARSSDGKIREFGNK